MSKEIDSKKKNSDITPTKKKILKKGSQFRRRKFERKFERRKGRKNKQTRREQ